jgi:hypothetical protein
MPFQPLRALSTLLAPAEGLARRHGKTTLALAVAVLAAYYLVQYALAEARPDPKALYPLGWWGWFDQGEYLKSIRAFATGALRSPDLLYPPLYALLSAPFWWLTRDHPALVPDLVYFLVAYGVLIAVARRFYGTLLPLVVCAALLVFLPVMTIDDWVIPWTTSLQAALVSGLIAIFSRSEAKAAPFALRSKADWGWFVGFFAAYGAIAPTRPLDIVIWFPFALAYFLLTTLATVREAPAARRIQAAAGCFLAASVTASVFVALYLGFNLKIHGSLFGSYGTAAGGNGYFLADIPEKIFSVFWSSGVVYGEPEQALFEKFAIFGPIFALCLVALVVVKDVRRWILLTAFLNFIVYLPYGDLLPNGFFRYHNLHYFKWAYPWLAVIAAGQLASWLGGEERRVRWAPLAASAGLVLIGCLVGQRPAASEKVATFGSSAEHLVRVRAHAPREVEFIDIRGLTGSFPEFYFGAHALKVDGVTQRVGTYRMMPIEQGARLMFVRPVILRELELKPSPGAVVADGPGDGVLSAVEIGLSCRIAPCVTPEPLLDLAWSPGEKGEAIAFDFRAGGDAHGADMAAWWGPEAWGAWTKGARTRLDLVAPPARRMSVETTAGPLLGGTRKQGEVRLLANGCEVARARFEAGDAVRPIGGEVPARCLRPDGRVSIEWRADAKARPVDLKMSGDTRSLGVAVRDLTLRRGT